MFNATGGGYVADDVLDFVMYASLIDEVNKGQIAIAGYYAIYVDEWLDLADNANYNMPTWTGAFTSGVKAEDAHYASMAGIYTVNKKQIVVTINDAESEYGEEIDNSIFSYTLPEGWQVGADTKEDLHITLTTDAVASSPVSGAGYAINGYSGSANYEVTFKGSYLNSTSGTLNIDPRRIVVVIHPQTSVYGTNPVANSGTNRWFVVREGAMVNATNQATDRRIEFRQDLFILSGNRRIYFIQFIQHNDETGIFYKQHPFHSCKNRNQLLFHLMHRRYMILLAAKQVKSDMLINGSQVITDRSDRPFMQLINPVQQGGSRLKREQF